MNTGFLIACSAIASITTIAGADLTYYLSPTGSDTAAGSREAPCATFERVQELIRGARKGGAKGNITVSIADGRYPIRKMISLSPSESAPEGALTIYRAAHPGRAFLDGGLTLPPLKPLTAEDAAYPKIPAEARPHVQVADLRAAGITEYGILSAGGVGDPAAEGMQLVWDGEFQTLARWPNDGFTGIAKVPPRNDPQGKRIKQTSFTYQDKRVSSWANEEDPYGNGFFCHNWAAAKVAFGKIDPQAQTISHKGSGSNYGYSTQAFWFGYNLLCELDAPGEYYLDRETGKLYFWPPSSTSSETPKLTFAKDLLRVSHASRTVFSGLVFENCRGTALSVNAKDIKIEKCSFRNIGNLAVRLHGERIVLAGCDIAYCNAGGILVSGGDQKTLKQADIEIRNNHIHHFALSDLTYHPAIRLYGCGIRAIRNTIHDGPHTAVLMGGRENDVSFNEIHSVCIESGEMGAVYAGRDWTLAGNQVNANYFHDIYNPRSQRNRAIMLDDGCAGFTMTSNRIVRVAEGISLSAIGNVIANNVFIDSYPPISCWQKWTKPDEYTNPRYTHKQLPEILAKIPVHEEPWKTRYPYLGMIDDAMRTGKLRHPDSRTVIRANYISQCSTNWCAYSFEKYACTPDAWRIESNYVSTQENPLTLEEAEKKGFAKLPPLSDIGVYPSEERLTWPISHPVTIKYKNLTFEKK